MDIPIPIPIFAVAAAALWLVGTIINWTVVKPMQRREREAERANQAQVWPPRPEHGSPQHGTENRNSPWE